jgi:hypothetical protein
MDYYKIFYWLTVADNAKSFFVAFIVVFMVIFIVAACFYLGGRDSDDWKISQIGKAGRKAFFWSLPFVVLFWALYVFTPSKKDSLLILAGGGTMQFLTTDSSAKKIPHELSNFVISELKSMAQEAKVEMSVQSQKDKILEEAKNMTANQLVERMKVDSVFAKIILNK